MFRNKEIRQFAGILAVITLIFAGAGFTVSTAAGRLVLASAAMFDLAFLLFTRARYQSIAGISDQINQILHNEDRLYIYDSEEGELSILQSEINQSCPVIIRGLSGCKETKGASEGDRGTAGTDGLADYVASETIPVRCGDCRVSV